MINYERLLAELQGKLHRQSWCPIGCADCCQRPVLMLYQEWRRLVHPLQGQAPDPQGQCPFLTGSQCTVYQQRPLPCRWHGLAEAGPNWCGLIRAETLATAQVEQVRRRWTLLLYRQLGEVLTGRRRSAERLAWLRYCLSLKEGRNIREVLESRLWPSREARRKGAENESRLNSTFETSPAKGDDPGVYHK